MDVDSILTPLSLKMAIRHFVNPEIGAVAGNVKVLNRKKIFTDLQALEYVEGLNMARGSENVIEASWYALVDSIEYKLLKEQEVKVKG